MNIDQNKIPILKAWFDLNKHESFLFNQIFSNNLFATLKKIDDIRTDGIWNLSAVRWSLKRLDWQIQLQWLGTKHLDTGGKGGKQGGIQKR